MSLATWLLRIVLLLLQRFYLEEVYKRLGRFHLGWWRYWDAL